MKQAKSWRPYIAGALVGLLSTASVFLSTKMIGKPKYIGASTTFVRSAGLIETIVAKGHVERNTYYKSKKVKVDWQFMLLVGILLGAFASSITDKTFRLEGVPPIWSDRFGNSRVVRAVGAFLGGIVAMFGARLAGGCPSGHGMSGLMQLSISGFIAMSGFFAAGIAVAHLVYRSGRKGIK